MGFDISWKIPANKVILNYTEFIEILKTINAQPGLNKENVISEVANESQRRSEIYDEELKKRKRIEEHPVYKTIYQNWKNNNFAIDHDILSEINIVDHTSGRLLHIATENGLARMVYALIEVGADVNAKDVLHESTLKAGANPFLNNECNDTPRDFANKWRNDAEIKKKIISLLEEEEKQSKKGGEEINLHSMQNDADSDYGEDDNQNEPSFFSKHKWKIAIGVGTAVGLIVCATLCLTANLPALSIIGIAVLSGFITGSIAFGINMISKPSIEIEEVAENNLEQHAHAVVEAD